MKNVKAKRIISVSAANYVDICDAATGEIIGSTSPEIETAPAEFVKAARRRVNWFECNAEHLIVYVD